jgi:thiazole biosynthesis enzyme
MNEKNIKPGTDVKIKSGFTGWLKKYASSDVIIVGGGPAGLMAAVDLAKLDLKILVIGSNSYVGGRLWVSDFLVSASIFMAQFKEILDELKIPYQKGKGGLSVAAGPVISSKLISATCDAGVKILNLAEFKDLICTDERVAGVVISWNPRLSLKDEIATSIPISLKCQIVVDATGMGAQVCQVLMRRGVIKPNNYEQADVRISEELLLENTNQIYPGLVVGGMAVATIYGIPLGGLSLCSILLSGRKIAQEVEMFFAENYNLPPKKKR